MSGSVSNITVPYYVDGNLVPGFYFSIDPSNANTALFQQRSLLIGQVGSTFPSGKLNSPYLPTSVSQAALYCGGANAMLARMYARFRKNNPFGEVWILPLADDPGAVATVQAVTLAGAATAAGTLSLYIAGVVTRVAVSIGDTAAVVAGNLSTAINANPVIPTTATVSGAVVTLTTDNKGLTAGDNPVMVNYLGAAGGEVTPAGISITSAVTTAGTTNPSLTAALANLGTTTYDFIAMPYTDTASLNSLQSLLDPVTGRWSWSQQLYGGCWTAYRGSLGQRTTLGLSRDDPFTSCLGYNSAPDTVYDWCADYCAGAALSLTADPGLPLGGAGDGIPLTVLPPTNNDVYANQSTLLADGISTYVVNNSGGVRVQRAVTFYTLNGAGQPDNAYRDPEGNYTLMAVIRDLLSALSSQFGRKKLVADGTVIAGGSNFVTSQTILAACIARYRLQCDNGLAQNPQQFASTARAQNAGNGLVKLYLPIQVVNQLRVVAGDVAFSKP